MIFIEKKEEARVSGSFINFIIASSNYRFQFYHNIPSSPLSTLWLSVGQKDLDGGIEFVGYHDHAFQSLWKALG